MIPHFSKLCIAWHAWNIKLFRIIYVLSVQCGYPKIILFSLFSLSLSLSLSEREREHLFLHSHCWTSVYRTPLRGGYAGVHSCVTYTCTCTCILLWTCINSYTRRVGYHGLFRSVLYWLIRISLCEISFFGWISFFCYFTVLGPWHHVIIYQNNVR